MKEILFRNTTLCCSIFNGLILSMFTGFFIYGGIHLTPTIVDLDSTLEHVNNFVNNGNDIYSHINNFMSKGDHIYNNINILVNNISAYQGTIGNITNSIEPLIDNSELLLKDAELSLYRLQKIMQLANTTLTDIKPLINILKNISKNINDFSMISIDDTIDNSISQNPLSNSPITHSPLPNLLTQNAIQEIA